MQKILDHVRRDEAVYGVKLVNYTKRGLPFHHVLDVEPLGDGLFRSTSRPVTTLASVDSLSHQMDLGDDMDEETECYCAMDTRLSTVAARAAAREFGPGGIYASPLGDPLQILRPAAAAPPMIVVTHAYPPYPIQWASDAWMQVCGFRLCDVVGRDLKLIQGTGTDRVAIGQMMGAVQRKEPIDNLQLVNYNKCRQPFRHTVKVEPIYADVPPDGEYSEDLSADPDDDDQRLRVQQGRPTLFRATSVDVRNIGAQRPELPGAQLSSGGGFSPFSSCGQDARRLSQIALGGLRAVGGDGVPDEVSMLDDVEDVGYILGLNALSHLQ